MSGAARGPVDLVAVGPVTRDLTMLIESLPGGGGSTVAGDLRIAAGGKGANPAVCARRLEARVRLIGAVGDDAAGEEVLSELRRDGIDITGVARYPQVTTGQIVHLVQPDGTRRYIESRGANERLSLTAGQVASACPPDAAVLVSTALPRRPCAPPSMVRVPPARSSSPTSPASGDLARVFDGKTEVRLPHLPTDVVDPTGGGDALVTTFTVLHARGDALARAGKLAAAAAAHTVAQLGGRPRFNGEGELAALAALTPRS